MIIKIEDRKDGKVIIEIEHTKKSLFDNSVVEFLDNLNKQYKLKEAK
jgi:hypothetical protein